MRHSARFFGRWVTVVILLSGVAVGLGARTRILINNNSSYQFDVTVARMADKEALALSFLPEAEKPRISAIKGEKIGTMLCQWSRGSSALKPYTNGAVEVMAILRRAKAARDKSFYWAITLTPIAKDTEKGDGSVDRLIEGLPKTNSMTFYVRLGAYDAPAVKTKKCRLWQAVGGKGCDQKTRHPIEWLGKDGKKTYSMQLTDNPEACVRVNVDQIDESGKNDIAFTINEPIVIGPKSDEQSITVVSYNIQGLPFETLANLVGISALAVNQQKRTRRMAAEIGQLGDVIVFQEAFADAARSTLVKGLKRQGFSYTAGPLSRGMNPIVGRLTHGGVFVASKYPIIFSANYFFDQKLGNEKPIEKIASDKIADKGVLYVRILKNDRIYHLFGTHMQSTSVPKARTIRLMQSRRIRAIIDSLKIPAHEPVFIVGDFNLSSQRTPAQLNAAIEALNATEPSLTGERINTAWAGKLPVQIDHILYSNTHRKPTNAYEQIYPVFAINPYDYGTKTQLSDHFPLVCYAQFADYAPITGAKAIKRQLVK